MPGIPLPEPTRLRFSEMSLCLAGYVNVVPAWLEGELLTRGTAWAKEMPVLVGSHALAMPCTMPFGDLP